MRANRSTDTGPERRLRSALHRRGYRFRVNCRLVVPDLSVRPDIVFPACRLAVFVDGCFWHCCPDHGTTPTVNTQYWNPKFQRIRDRDLRVDTALRAAGWEILRF